MSGDPADDQGAFARAKKWLAEDGLPNPSDREATASLAHRLLPGLAPPQAAEEDARLAAVREGIQAIPAFVPFNPETTKKAPADLTTHELYVLHEKAVFWGVFKGAFAVGVMLIAIVFFLRVVLGIGFGLR